MGRARRLPMTKGGTALFKAYGRVGRGATKRLLGATAAQLTIILDSVIGTNEWGQSRGQSLIGLRTLIQRVTDPGWTVVDPFLGGGTTALACVQINRKFLEAGELSLISDRQRLARA